MLLSQANTQQMLLDNTSNKLSTDTITIHVIVSFAELDVYGQGSAHWVEL